MFATAMLFEVFMSFRLFRICLVILTLLTAMTAAAQKDPYVGDVSMSPKKTLLDNLSASPIHTDLVKLLHSTQMDQVLASGGPYTVFAPTDDAFRKLQRSVPPVPLPAGEALASLLGYHVVQGRITLKQLNKLMKKGHGTATLRTLDGQSLVIKRYGNVAVLTDTKGGTATLVTADILSTGGVFHVIDAVLMPTP